MLYDVNTSTKNVWCMLDYKLTNLIILPYLYAVNTVCNPDIIDRSIGLDNLSGLVILVG